MPVVVRIVAVAHGDVAAVVRTAVTVSIPVLEALEHCRISP
jgi:hypothetical protein